MVWPVHRTSVTTTCLAWNPVRSETRWRHQMGMFSALLAFSERNAPVASLRPATRSFDFSLRLNKRLSKQSRRRWFETHRSHNDVTVMVRYFRGVTVCHLWLATLDRPTTGVGLNSEFPPLHNFTILFQNYRHNGCLWNIAFISAVNLRWHQLSMNVN